MADKRSNADRSDIAHQSPATGKAVVQRAAAKQPRAKNATAKKAPAKKSVAKTAVARKSVAKTAAAKKTPAKKAVAKRAPGHTPAGERRKGKMRTAGGKRPDAEQRLEAERESRDFLRERTEEGHLKAGRLPPSQKEGSRRAGASRKFDTDLRLPPVTEDEKLLQQPGPRTDFTRSDPWRVLRITGEFIEGFDVLASVDKGVSIFGSARTGPEDPQYEAAQETARLLGEAGFSIITGAGPGIMEAANKGAREAGAHSIGCNIELPFEQGANPYVDTLINFRYFMVRKTMFIKYSVAFIIFPGGFGTLDELFEALTLIQTGKIYQFPVILFGRHYWAGLVRWIQTRLLGERKISPGDVDLMLMTDDPAEAARAVIEAYRAQTRDTIAREEQTA